MARVVNREGGEMLVREGYDERGQRQRTARSTNVYIPKTGFSDGTSCRGCGAVYKNKRWQLEGAAAGGNQILCPACQRMEDNVPAGVLRLSGPYLSDHKEEIMNSLRSTEASSRVKNPLGRIMEIREEDNGITITTTEDKLAQKLGRQIFKSQRGELHYKWSYDPRQVRVEWSR
jgi:NMD protein affecting ribosome stability and mRNA decay